MENGLKQQHRGWVILAGIGTVVLLSALAILLFYRCRKPEVLDLRGYVDLGRSPSGEPTARLDTEAILHDLHLPSSESDPHAFERLPEVRAIAEIELVLAAGDEEDTMRVSVSADTETLERAGIVLAPLSWEQQLKGVLSESVSPSPSPVPAAPTPTPEPYKTGYLTALVDAEGNGYNLRAVCERVQKERDDVCKGLTAGSTDYSGIKADKIQVAFSVGKTAEVYKNIYSASYKITLESAVEGSDDIVLYYRIRLVNLKLSADGTVSFDPQVFSQMCKNETECKRAPSPSGSYTTTVLSGGGVRVRDKAAFDQNGFVLFPGCPTSYRMADGFYWSPTCDPLPEELIWKLTAVDGHSLANLLRYARKEIYARYYTMFDPKTEREFYEHYHSFPWYREMSPDLSSRMSETERANIRLLREIQSLIEK